MSGRTVSLKEVTGRGACPAARAGAGSVTDEVCGLVSSSHQTQATFFFCSFSLRQSFGSPLSSRGSSKGLRGQNRATQWANKTMTAKIMVQ